MIRRARTHSILTLLLLPASTALAQHPTTHTVAFSGVTAENGRWLFFGDTVVGVVDTGSGVVTSVLRAFSTATGNELWTQALESGHTRRPIDVRVRSDVRRHRLFVGAGPVHLVDLTTGSVRWSKSCAEVGYIVPSLIKQVGADRIALVGNIECKNVGGFWRELSIRNAVLQNLKRPRVMLLDAATGQTLWSYESRPRLYHLSGGPEMVDFSYWLDAPGGTQGVSEAIDTTAIDRIILSGDRLEGVRLADGSAMWQSDSGIGESIAKLGRLVFVIRQKTLSAFHTDSGRLAWTLPLDADRASLYSSTDLAAIDSMPVRGKDLFVSTRKTVWRVDPATGSPRWSVPREGAWWQATSAWFYVQSDDSVNAYDPNTGASGWSLVGGKRLRAVAQDDAGPDTIVVFADRGTYDDRTDEYKGPFRFWGVSLRSGAVRWKRDAVAGRPITFWARPHEGQLRLGGERLAQYVNVNIADGSDATDLADPATERFVTYRRDDQRLRCQDYSGNVIWERPQRLSKNASIRVRRALGYVLWPYKDGVEVIDLEDGQSLWSIRTDSDPYVIDNDAGTAFVVPSKGNASIVRVEP